MLFIWLKQFRDPHNNEYYGRYNDLNCIFLKTIYIIYQYCIYPLNIDTLLLTILVLKYDQVFYYLFCLEFCASKTGLSPQVVILLTVPLPLYACGFICDIFWSFVFSSLLTVPRDCVRVLRHVNPCGSFCVVSQRKGEQR